MSTYSTEVLADNPVAFWEFNETSGSTVADSSGNGYDGTVFGAGLDAAGPGSLKAVEFDGIDDYIYIGTPSMLARETACTYEWWANPYSSGTGDGGNMIYNADDKATGPTVNYGFRIRTETSDNRPRMLTRLGNEDTWYPVLNAPTFSYDGTWYHFVLTWDNGTLRWYVNGELQEELTGSHPQMGTETATASVVWLGGRPGVQELFHGKLAGIACYDTVLPATRIQAHYNTVDVSDPDPPGPDPDPTSKLLSLWTGNGQLRTQNGILRTYSLQNIFLDTDISGDCDDVGAVAVLHSLASVGACQIIGMAVSVTCSEAPGALDALNKWHGRQVPIGQFKGTPETASVDRCFGNSSANFVSALYNGFPRDLGTSVDDAVDVYRQALHDAKDASVKIVTIGYLNNLADVLQSPADDIDPRNGSDLIAAKVSEVYIMGGRRDTGSAEHNLKSAPAAADYVANNCPVPIIFNPYEIGYNVITGTTNFDWDDHIVRVAYDIFDNATWTNTTSGHYSWDLVTVFQAVMGDGIWFARDRGTLTINPSTGVDSWEDDSNGPHYYTVIVGGMASILEDAIEPLMWSPQA